MDENPVELAGQLVEQLKGADSAGPNRAELISLITAAQSIIHSQPMLVELSAPMKIVGNIHGDFSGLLNIFNKCGWPPTSNYLFLGDYVDVGQRQVDSIALLLALKIRYPDNIYLLRGHHEVSEVNSLGGFKAECQRRDYDLQIFQKFNDLFSYMPLSALIGGRILCVHGGIPKELQSLHQLNLIPRPFQVQSDRMEVDLLWGNPAEIVGWQFNQANEIGHTFGPGILQQFCHQHDLNMVVRSHQVCPNGFKLNFSQFFTDSKLVTLFSTPNYGGVAGNKAAVMSVAENLSCTFNVIGT